MSYPAVSSNTLFHFTSKLEYLINILTNNFRPRYCLEMFSSLSPLSLDFAFPMTCFCDLPLSNTGKHLATYGNYGIGLTKEWGMRKGLNPVLYIQKDSDLFKAINRSTMAFALLLKDGDVAEKLVEGLINLQFFTKPYTGDFLRGGKVVKNVRFYDEREWRFVPKPDNNEYYRMKSSVFENIHLREESNRSLPVSAMLEYEPDDVRYIIVDREDEILQTVDDILQIKGSKYSDDQLKLLTTRIISAERIREDF